MNTKAISESMVSTDMKALIAAALARINEIPVTDTLIDRITDDEWLNADCSEWVVCAGADQNGSSEELDDSDVEAVKVA